MGSPDSHPSESGCGRWLQEPPTHRTPNLQMLQGSSALRKGQYKGPPVVLQGKSHFHMSYRTRFGDPSRGSAVKKQQPRGQRRSPSSCWFRACSQRHTLWVSQGAGASGGFSQMSLPAPESRLRTASGTPATQAPNPSLCTGPPQVHAPGEGLQKPAATCC